MTKVPFFCNLPRETVAEINRRRKAAGCHQWEVVVSAVSATMPVAGGPRRKARGGRG